VATINLGDLSETLYNRRAMKSEDFFADRGRLQIIVFISHQHIQKRLLTTYRNSSSFASFMGEIYNLFNSCVRVQCLYKIVLFSLAKNNKHKLFGKIRQW
jgi:hypothetical protein